ncbi:MAG TPA: crotonase/enoyl-CoA hydratase family protein [Acidimicrobiales bacterium]|jgi:enoyl-CoA hydratase|nr:crotonase/enoyl-CoA hydratase family protein [Acidimicrobiales bacterium]
MSDLVSYELDGRIASITFDDGKANAFSIPMLKALHEAFDRAEADQAVTLLTGRPGIFSAGFDLKVFASGDGAASLEMLTLGARLYERVMSFPTPVVVACTGHAYPAGAFLLLSADARVAADGPFRIGLNEVRIGLTLPWFAIEIARHRLQPAYFDRAVVNATMYSPTEAVTAGFLDYVVPADDLRQRSLEIAGDLTELDPKAHKATKLRARANALTALRSAIDAELTSDNFVSPST